MSNRRMKETPMVLDWFGDLSKIRQFLEEKPWCSFWGLVKLCNAVIRSYGVVAFANNPLSGCLILIAMFIGNPLVGCAALLASLVAVVCSKLLGAPDGLVCDGVTSFNSVLLGCLITAVLPDVVGDVPALHYWPALTAALIITSYVDLGLNALMSSCGLPATSLPFNIVAVVGLLAARGRHFGYEIQYSSSQHEDAIVIQNINATDTMMYDEEVDWIKVMEGTLLAVGQIYGVGTMTPSILIWIAFLIYSPILSCCFYIGSLIGGSLGVYLVPGSLSAVYAGLWGYNSLLTAGGLAYFLKPSFHALMAILIGAVMTAFTQAAIMPLFLATQMPVFSFPFAIVTTTILAISTKKGTALSFLKEWTYPERHVYECFTSQSQDLERGDTEAEIRLNSG